MNAIILPEYKQSNPKNAFLNPMWPKWSGMPVDLEAIVNKTLTLSLSDSQALPHSSRPVLYFATPPPLHLKCGLTNLLMSRLYRKDLSSRHSFSPTLLHEEEHFRH